jgi:hypothetical protein
MSMGLRAAHEAFLEKADSGFPSENAKTQKR